MSICAVIPAAGRGTRLGGDVPKVFTPVTASETVWNILHQKLSPLVDHVLLVLSPEGAAMSPVKDGTSIGIQSLPTGMGDAIFSGYDVWSRYDAILVVWGDQVFVSADTLSRTIAARAAGRNVVLPVTRMAQPYVEYVFDQNRLMKVLQTREGDVTTPNGFSDVGTFLLNTAGLKAAWDAYRAGAGRGSATGEINFLPFLPWLATRGWNIAPVEVADPVEARGINTREDLEFFRARFR